MGQTQFVREEQLHSELFASFVSLLRSYTALHGLPSGRQASVESNPESIRVSHGERCLTLTRHHQIVTWTRENGDRGTFEVTKAGNLRIADREQAMDLAAEHWARELMQ